MSALELFHPLIRKWFSQRLGPPTEVQERAWPVISNGSHVLVTAPTGSGKTLTAFLWALHRMLSGQLSTGSIRVLYISPLKALNNDMRQNLLTPLEELRNLAAGENTDLPRISVAVRSGDTPPGERRALLHRPPEIFITTPESLNILLTSGQGEKLFGNLAVVILDEVHAVVSQKRGTLLITAVERLVPICGEFQRIALSATVRPLEVVARFVGGYRMRGSGKTVVYEERPVSIIRVLQGKQYAISVCAAAEADPVAAKANPTAAEAAKAGAEAKPTAAEAEPAAVEAAEAGGKTADKTTGNVATGDTAAGGTAPRGTIPGINANGPGMRTGPDVVWDTHAAAFLKQISAHRSTLLFVNSRKTSERVARVINERAGDLVAYSHHGSLSREIRLAVEDRLKKGELKAIVATSSLELGIDIGDLDQVILIQTPPTLSAAVQRIGRAGHKVGEVSRGLMYPLFGTEYILAAVAGRCIINRQIEPVHPVLGALDILAQVILSMTAVRMWDRDRLYNFLRCCFPYHTLSRRQYDLVISMLAGRYADIPIKELSARLSIDKIDNTLTARRGVPFLIYLSGGSIPDRGYYNLRLQGSKAKIGELDEEFVWERNIGDTFALGIQAWQIRQITHNDVEVAPAQRGRGMIPFWRADPRNRDFYFSGMVLDFLEKADTELGTVGFETYLKEECCLGEGAAAELVRYLVSQKQVLGTALPHRHHIVIEYFNDPDNISGSKQVILHTFWGGRVNRPFALALSQAWAEDYHYPLEVFADDDCMLLNLPHNFHAADLFTRISADRIETLLKRKLQSTAFFGALFRQNAGRALLLPRASFSRRMPLWLNRLRAQKLFKAVSRYEDFPLLLETWRQCFQDEFDLPALRMLLDEVAQGRITVSETTTVSPSPFAANIIWRQTNKFMYRDDTPTADSAGTLSEELFREVTSSALLRPRFPRELITELEHKLQRTAPGYAPANRQELLDWVIERLFIPETEWENLAETFNNDNDDDFGKVCSALAGKLVKIRFTPGGESLVAAVENIPRVCEAFRIRPNALLLSPLTEITAERNTPAEKYLSGIRLSRKSVPDPGAAMAELIEQFLGFYGPLDPQRLCKLFGLSDQSLIELTRDLRQDERILYEPLSKDARGPELCTIENTERLLRMYRGQRRHVFSAIPVAHLPLFLACIQDVLNAGGEQSQLEQTLEKLFGFAAPPAAWEEYIFPARLKPYHQARLDSTMQKSDLLWLGLEGRRLGFCFPEDTVLFSQIKAAHEKLLPGSRGRYSLFDIAAHTGLDTAKISEQVWKQGWQGILTNDSFEAVRKGILNGFKPEKAVSRNPGSARRSYARWRAGRALTGNWYMVPYEDDENSDPVAELEIQRRRVRQVLERYGVVFKELLTHEIAPLRWSALFRTLRIMELSGEIWSGHFFQGIPGLQFASAKALRLLNSGLPQEHVFWLNAADPASVCGLGLEPLRGSLPRRIAANCLVYHGIHHVLSVLRNGRSLAVFVEPDHPRLGDYYRIFNDLVNREFNAPAAIKVQTVNDIPAARSAYKESLLRSGFREEYKALVLRKQY